MQEAEGLSAMQKIQLVGGDKRQLELCSLLKKKGYHVGISGFHKLGIDDKELNSPDYVFLPVPYRLTDGSLKMPYAERSIYIEDVVAMYPCSRYVLGGGDGTAQAVLGDKLCLDLLENEAFLVRNALLTAQAAVCAYHNASSSALFGQNCVVVGFGRIGKFLCRLLSAHGAKVTATARKPADIELIKAEGYHAVHTIDAAMALKNADTVWNTVPQHVLKAETLVSLRKEALVTELASPPYGMDLEEAKRLGANVRLEQSLPGRYFPTSAALAILHAFESEVR